MILPYTAAISHSTSVVLNIRTRVLCRVYAIASGETIPPTEMILRRKYVVRLKVLSENRE